ncbi:MAG: hypothetical protein ACR2HO_00865 [Rubrobacteraceae bacterium]
MSMDGREPRLSSAGLMWGMVWRSVVWYAVAGAAHGADETVRIWPVEDYAGEDEELSRGVA